MSNINKTNKIQELKKQGYKVRVGHERFVLEKVRDGLEVTLTPTQLVPITKENRKDYQIYCKGGRTTIEITAPDGREVKGVAKCHINDPFNRKVAIAISLGRALKQLKNKTE